MKNGVFFRLALAIPKKGLARWKKAKLASQRKKIEGSFDAHEDSALLEECATVGELLQHLASQAKTGAEMTIVRVEKDGNVEVRGYLGGWESYSTHFFPLLFLGAACGDAGEGTLVFLADRELTDEPVFVHARFSKGNVELEHHDEPQDITEEQIGRIEKGFGDGGAEAIEGEHATWIAGHRGKKTRRDRAGRVGWLRADGTFAIEPRFRAAAGFSEGLALVSEEGPYDFGYIDERGELVIPYCFFDAGGFRCGRARVGLESGNEGYIDRTGELVIPATWSHTEAFQDDRAIVGNGDLRGFVDRDGKVIVEPKYETAKGFTDGLALVAVHDEWETGGFGFLDRDGAIAIPLAFERAGIFHQGLAPASKEGKWGFLDRTGAWRIEPRFDETRYFFDGRAIARVKKKWGLVDDTGRIVIPFEHAELHQHGEWFLARKKKGTTVFSRDGAILFETPYAVIGERHDGGVTIAKSYAGPFGYMAVDGRVILEPRFEFAAPFSDGLAIVNDGGAWGIIDPSGAMTVRFDFELFPSAGASHFAKKNGLAYIESGNQYGLVDRSGRVVHPPELEELVGFGEELIFARYPEDLD